MTSSYRFQPLFQTFRPWRALGARLGLGLALGLGTLGAGGFAAPVLAQSTMASIVLKANPATNGPDVTLGNLFEGVPAAKAGIVVGKRVGPTTFLDAGQVQVIAAREGLNWSNTGGLSRISVRSGAESGGDATALPPTPHAPLMAQAQPVRSASKPRPAAATAQVLVYARNITAGELIAPEDLIWSSEVGARPPGAVRTPEDLTGYTAKYALRAGQPVEFRQVSPPKVIRKNDIIYVDWSESGVSLSLQARALDDGAVGQTIQVMNTQSKKTIEAVVAGPGRAVTGQAAESLKRSSSTPSR